MSSAPRPQRIRDPLHNLIDFGTDQFERVIWSAIQTRPFQRLRRIKQLGFSELVYPGATHTRFSHSVGVFHIARRLMSIIRRHMGEARYQEHQAQVALAAALVHDLGHGMFSHAFEEVGKTLGIKMARHEHVSDLLIRSEELQIVFSELGKCFADEVAEVIGRRGPSNLYDAVVSSQFDADRLDYMQRDRLMTGVQNSGIDFTWLMANLEVGTLPTGVDDQPVGGIETFVLGPKAFHAAESFVLSLFQLYPNVYFHKATRGAEKVFSALMLRLIGLVRDGLANKLGLPSKHPILMFAKDPDSLENALSLDDTVFLGGVPLLATAKDDCIRHFAVALRDRKLPKCINVRERLTSGANGAGPANGKSRLEFERELELKEILAKDRIEDWSKKNSGHTPRVLIDRADRDPYKRFEESKGPLNQIRIRAAGDTISDMAESSLVVAAMERFKLFRVYIENGDEDARIAVERIITEASKEPKHAAPKRRSRKGRAHNSRRRR